MRQKVKLHVEAQMAAMTAAVPWDLPSAGNRENCKKGFSGKSPFTTENSKTFSTLFQVEDSH